MNRSCLRTLREHPVTNAPRDLAQGPTHRQVLAAFQPNCTAQSHSHTHTHPNPPTSRSCSSVHARKATPLPQAPHFAKAASRYLPARGDAIKGSSEESRLGKLFRALPGPRPCTHHACCAPLDPRPLLIRSHL